jgi:thioesterase domain-containing protein
MRRCQRCGEEFSVLRHILLRGEFCSKKCFEAYKKDDARMRALVSGCRTDNQVNVPTYSGNVSHGALPCSVIQLREGKADITLYFIGGEVAEFRIAQLMGFGHSIYGIEIPWPSAWRDAANKNDTSALPTMEQLVAPYVAALRVHTRSSPCVLAGHSFGGLMAFEAAHQLQEQGGKVDMVILLDAQAKYPAPHQVAWQMLQNDWKRAPKCSTARTSQSIASRLANSLSIIGWMLVKELRGLGRWFLQAVLQDPGALTPKLDDLGKPLHWGLIERLYANASRSYRLRRLDGRGVLFRAEPRDDRVAQALGDGLGWDNLFSRGLEIIEVPGDHVTMMRWEPHILTLARGISELLNRLCTKSSDEPARIF